jgi:GST-like protein
MFAQPLCGFGELLRFHAHPILPFAQRQSTAEEMITLYTADTPNGHKAAIALEELEIPYAVRLVALSAGEQHRPEFLGISPNNKIPVIVDEDEQRAIFESGAILIHLADKRRFLLPPHGAGRSTVLQWLFMQVGSIGPMLGQLWWFRHGTGEPNPPALERYAREAQRLFRVVDRRLAQSPYIGGPEYSIADIAMFPWLRTSEELGIEIGAYPHVQAWLEALAARPAVQAGLAAARAG